MNTGMQDAANLAWKLALVCRGAADQRILDSYQDERHPVGARVVRTTTMMANAMTLSGFPAQVRNVMISGPGRVAPLRRALADTITETSVDYRRSPIVASPARRSRRSIKPGSYAPDLTGLLDQQGHDVRVADLLRTPGHILLALTADPGVLDELRGLLGPIGRVVPVVRLAAGAPAGALIDSSQIIAAGFGIGDHGLALIRPDGYLGYLSTTPDPQHLQAYLRDRLHLTGRELGPRA